MAEPGRVTLKLMFTGHCLRMILQKNPNIREGINFDLPEVVAKAPNFPRVTHVGGDMFKLIPEADAVFMKVRLLFLVSSCPIGRKDCGSPFCL
ncbi:hypothetical protein SLEP1_g45637 [Rubroshorea leprosula]|uniref:O-methyltransferase C-terminal domain-containing protein n=1 Tax=Rubroshorea leprosula TaxID=152421 RepID=A0AAV5LKE9_9ROSI|nr:hypothetical protein SLEP1_g45637 [Rubroshorea leprosula]